MKVTRKGIAKAIWDAMKDHEPEMTIKQLSEKSDVGERKLAMVISENIDKSGNKRYLNTDELIRVSEALEVSPYELLTGIDEENRKECENLGLSNDTVNRLRELKNNRLVQSAIDALVSDWDILIHIAEYFRSDFASMQRTFKNPDGETKIEWFNASELSLHPEEIERVFRLRLLDDMQRIRNEIMQQKG